MMKKMFSKNEFFCFIHTMYFYLLNIYVYMYVCMNEYLKTGYFIYA